jgi:hypothetical protein
MYSTRNGALQKQNKKPFFKKEEGLLKKIRQRPTLPFRYQNSTIGAGGLNFCVRDGNRCSPSAIATENKKQ